MSYKVIEETIVSDVKNMLDALKIAKGLNQRNDNPNKRFSVRVTK